MSNPTFEVTAFWDDDAKIWVAKSDIVGLHVEAETLEEFSTEVRKHAAYLIVENHYKDRELDKESLKDLIPAIFWREEKSGQSAA